MAESNTQLELLKARQERETKYGSMVNDHKQRKTIKALRKQQAVWY